MRVNRLGADEKWRTGGRAAGAKWHDNAVSPATDWEGPTAAAQDLWATRVAEAAADGSFAEGVHTAGNDKYKDKIREHGPGQYISGFTPEAQIRYNTAMTPFWNRLEAMTLPPRGATIRENVERVIAVAEALREVSHSS